MIGKSNNDIKPIVVFDKRCSFLYDSIFYNYIFKVEVFNEKTKINVTLIKDKENGFTIKEEEFYINNN